MARKRIAGTTLNSWDEADGALHDIGLIDIKLAEIEGVMGAEILAAKQTAKEKAARHLERKKALELALKEWTELHRDEIKGKTRKLTFGSVGFRLSTKVVIKLMAYTIQILKQIGRTDCIRIKEEADKEMLATLDDKTLARVGASRKMEDAFGYEVDIQKIREEAA